MQYIPKVLKCKYPLPNLQLFLSKLVIIHSLFFKISGQHIRSVDMLHFICRLNSPVNNLQSTLTGTDNFTVMFLFEAARKRCKQSDL